MLQTPHNSGNAALPRNTGIGEARGEYLLILDGDDYFELDMCAKAYARAKAKNADICEFRFWRTNGTAGTATGVDANEQANNLSDSLYNRPELRRYDTFTARDFNFIRNFAYSWAKMYKTEFILKNKLRFVPPLSNSCCDEIYFVVTAFFYAERICIMPNRFVHHLHNTGIMSKLRNERSVDTELAVGHFTVLRWLREFLSEGEFSRKHSHEVIDRYNRLLCELFTDVCLLHIMCSDEATYERMKNELFPEAGVYDMPKEWYDNPGMYDLVQMIPAMTFTQYCEAYDTCAAG